MSRQDMSAVSNQDHNERPKHRSSSRQTEGEEEEEEEEELPPRLPSSGTISTTEAKDQSTNSQEDSTRNFGLQESPVATSHVVLIQYARANHSSSSQLSMQPNTNAEAVPTPPPHISQEKFPAVQAPPTPMNHTTRIGTADETVPNSCPVSAPNAAHKPSHLHPRNFELTPNLQPPRLQTLNPSPREAEGATEGATQTGRTADCNYAYDSETEDLVQLSRSAVGVVTKQENTDVKSKLSETEEYTKKVEFTKPPPKNQLVMAASDTPNCQTSARTISPVNNTSVGKSGSFSIPTRSTNVKQVRPGSPGGFLRPNSPGGFLRPNSPGGFLRPNSPGNLAFRRREISPRNFMSAISVTSSDSKPSRIPRLVQKSARALAVNGNPAAHCDNRYSVYNVFSIIMMSGSDDKADRLDSLLTPMVAAESVIDEDKRCSVIEHRSYLHPAIRRIQTYEPVRISTEPSETASAVISVEEPKVVNTLLNVSKAETLVITMTEFRDAIRVYEPVEPTDKPDVTEQTNKDEAIGSKPSAEKIVSRETSTAQIVSIIPSVVVASAQVKKQKKSKPVQPKVQQPPVQPSVRHAVQPAVQSLVQPSVKSLDQAAVPGSRTSSLASSIVEVSFTDLDKKAFQPPQPKVSSREQSHNSKIKVRNSKGHSRTSTPNESKTETTRATSRAENLSSASRSVLKAIVKALLASNGAQRPGYKKENSDEGTGLKASSNATVTSPFMTRVLSSSTSGPQTKSWSANVINQSASSAIANSNRTQPGLGENLGGQYPLGSSVTQIFSKHRKHRQQVNASENSTSWSKALYAKTLYFKDETKQNPQKQTNNRNLASSVQTPPSKMKPRSSKSERSNEDLAINHDRFHSAEMTLFQRAANIPSASSVADGLDEPYASLEKHVNDIIMSRFGRMLPIQIKG